MFCFGLGACACRSQGDPNFHRRRSPIRPRVVRNERQLRRVARVGGFVNPIQRFVSKRLFRYHPGVAQYRYAAQKIGALLYVELAA